VIELLPEPIRALIAQIEAVLYVAQDDGARAPISVGPSAEAVLGFTPEELCAEPELFMGHIHPEDAPRVRAELAAARGLPFLPLKYRFLHKSGRVLWCRETQVMQPGAGVLAGVAVDVTELELPQRALQSALAAVDTRAAVVAICEAVAQSFGLTRTLYLDARSRERALIAHGPLGVQISERWDEAPMEAWGRDALDARSLRIREDQVLELLSRELQRACAGARFGFALPIGPEAGEPMGVLIGLGEHPFALHPMYQRGLTQLARQASFALQRAELLDALRRTGRERQHLADALVRAHEAERGRLARELHDGAGQTLTAVAIQLDLAEQSALPEARPPLALARQQLERTLEELRRLSHALRPAALDDLGLADALAEMGHALQTHAFEVRVETPEGLPAVAGEVATCLFRIAQSALTNVVRHARATRAVVRLQLLANPARPQAQALQLEVEDDGTGIADADPTGIGLLAMRERAVALGGRFFAENLSERGARVTAWVPLEE